MTNVDNLSRLVAGWLEAERATPSGPRTKTAAETGADKAPVSVTERQAGALRALCGQLERGQPEVFEVVCSNPAGHRRLLGALIAEAVEANPVVEALAKLLGEGAGETGDAPAAVEAPAPGAIQANGNRGVVTGHHGQGVVAGGHVTISGGNVEHGSFSDEDWMREPAPVGAPAPVGCPRGGPLPPILFLGANPTDSVRLRVDEEVREVDRVLRTARSAVRLILAQRWAVRTRDLGQALLEERPAVVHFCGHGTARGLLLEDVGGRGRPVTGEVLESLFRPHRETLRCVVLNACYSQSQAEAIARVIDCVVGMEAAVSDRAAIHFARGFYQALAYGAHLEDAFEAGQAEVTLETGEGTGDVVRLLTPRIDADQIRLV